MHTIIQVLTTAQKYEILREWLRNDAEFQDSFHHKLNVCNSETVESQVGLLNVKLLSLKQAAAVMAELTK